MRKCEVKAEYLFNENNLTAELLAVREVTIFGKKKSLLIYYDYQSHFNFLTDEQLGKIVRAMLDYEINGVLPEFDETIMKMTFSFIKSNLDRDREKYFKMCKTNKENGGKGGRPPKNQNDEQYDEQTDTTDEQTNTAKAECFRAQDNADKETAKRKAEFYSKVQEYESMKKK